MVNASLSSTRGYADAKDGPADKTTPAYLHYKWSVLHDRAKPAQNIFFAVLAMRIIAKTGGGNVLAGYDFCDTNTPIGTDFALLLELHAAGLYGHAPEVANMFTNPAGQEACGYATTCQYWAFMSAGGSKPSHEMLHRTVDVFETQANRIQQLVATRLLQNMRYNRSKLADGFGMYISNMGLLAHTDDYSYRD